MGEIGFQCANGAIAGVVGVGASYPLDLVKTKFQLNKAEFNGKLLNAFQAVMKERGVRGLYGGSMVNLTLIPLEKSLKLVVNAQVRKRLTDSNGHISVPSQVIAGASAGLAQSIVTSPMEMFKIGGQTGVPISDIYKQRTKGVGIRGIYTGYCSTIIRDIPFSIVYFPAYALLREAFAGHGKEPTFWDNFFAGLTAGLTGAVVVTPADCIKTRIQKKGGISWMNAFKEISTEGYNQGRRKGQVQAFFNGGLARGIVVAILFGFTQVVFELEPAQKLFGV